MSSQTKFKKDKEIIAEYEAQIKVFVSGDLVRDVLEASGSPTSPCGVQSAAYAQARPSTMSIASEESLIGST
ncbi:hypothetical protein STEG23_033345 [Scotinomys teguina]